jgi:hypothetical protein
MPGWEITRQDGSSTYWRDASGDIISLTSAPAWRHQPQLATPDELHRRCRALAEGQRAGLIEVIIGEHPTTDDYAFIYKRLKVPAFTFFGMVRKPASAGSWIWMVIAGERGTTGVREAVIAGQLMNSGRLTVESYETSWAQDPYDPSYRGVDRSTLRYLSDGEEYDRMFPEHPLTKVRREVHRLFHLRLNASTAA